MVPNQLEIVLHAMREFADEVKRGADESARIGAQPEDQLKSPVKKLVETIGTTLRRDITVRTETKVENIGRPDMAILDRGLLIGYIELKAPGVGTTKARLRGRDLLQFNRFRALPNLIYTDGIEWSFYRRKDQGEENSYERGFRVTLEEVLEIGSKSVDKDAALDMISLFNEFLNWSPTVPGTAKGLAQLLAPLTKLLRADVREAVGLNGAIHGVYEDWKRTLFPEASPDEFADSYAQTVAYGLLLARISGSHVIETQEAARAIQNQSGLLARTLEILLQSDTDKELGASLDLLRRTVDAVEPNALSGTKDNQDPWLYFYEDFLAVYDPKLRNERGVYYTPAQVVQAQVRLVDDVLRTHLNRPDGMADKNVTILDPALGTGTYLLSSMQHAVDHMAKRYGPGAAKLAATQMAKNLFGFELLVGPYAVANVRLTQMVKELGGRVPDEGVQVYLTDTLESPNGTKQVMHSQFEKPLAEEHARARQIKSKQKILVCIGNPPYERKDGDGSGTEDTAGGWIRFGDDTTTMAPLSSFIEPARRAGAARYLRNMYNAYVYFWRWAMWKVLDSQDGPGVVCFVTASSYLQGQSFVGMREAMRRSFDEIWILDLGGEGRGTRTSENVFDILTPVAIGIGIRKSSGDNETPARVHYSSIEGKRQQLFSLLEESQGLDSFEWEDASDSWTDPFIPIGLSAYTEMPKLTDIFPWQSPGTKLHRSWPIASDETTLRTRWSALASSQSRADLFRETRDRQIHKRYEDQIGEMGYLKSIESLTKDDPIPDVVPYAFRTFDLQKIIRDTRLGDRNRPALWKSMSSRQIYLTTLLTSSIGNGTAITAAPSVPDLHHFRGSYGGKDIMPLYRDAETTQPNITGDLIRQLESTLSIKISPEDLMAYITGIMGSPAYTGTFEEELATPGPRVPITKDADLFQKVSSVGRKVIAYQTYGYRFADAILATPGRIPQGTAQLTTSIPDTPEKYPEKPSDIKYNPDTRELSVGEGVVSFVAPEVWNYEVSGFRPVKSWIGYRVKNRAGKKSSPLDDIRPETWDWEMTQGLLQLLWAIEGVIALESEQAGLLERVLAGGIFRESELPKPTEDERKAPIIGVEIQPKLL